MNKCMVVIPSTVMEYIDNDNNTNPNVLNCKTSELTLLPSKLKPTLHLNAILLKVREATIKYDAEK